MNKIIIAMPTENEFMPSISHWGHKYNWSDSEVHFVHVIRKEVYVPMVTIREYPDEATYEKIKKSMLTFIEAKAKEIMPEQAFKNAHFDILFDPSPAEAMVDYAKKINADLVVVATRHKTGFAGLVTSSFADRFLKFAPCDVLILRPI